MIEFDRLADASRLLFEARLTPVQGSRFQPTGFPDIGAATFVSGTGSEMLLVESTQSMANRLEAVCWDEARGDLVQDLQGMPYVVAESDTLGKTTSLQEFHRLNSPYILGDEKFKAQLRNELGLPEKASLDEDTPGAVDLRKLAKVAFKYDPGSVLHGVFLEKIAGRLRLARLLSAFIEAMDVTPVESGGVKLDRLNPTGKAGDTEGAAQGFGNVPHHRVEYSAKSITAFFNFDLAALRGYGLPPAAERFLIALSLWKVRRFLETGLRLRTACDFDLDGDLVVRRPKFEIPSSTELGQEVKALIAECKPIFASPAVTTVKFTGKSKKK